ncbi:MAG: hypothetical protein P1U63_10120 [Coxiellaceae bacterium]|nr:hypothetical protein [Coxiellaceae bacterium]
MPKRPKPKEPRYNLRARENGKVVKSSKEGVSVKAAAEVYTEADRVAAATLVAMRNQLHRGAPGVGVSEGTAEVGHKVLRLRGG